MLQRKYNPAAQSVRPSTGIIRTGGPALTIDVARPQSTALRQRAPSPGRLSQTPPPSSIEGGFDHQVAGATGAGPQLYDVVEGGIETGLEGMSQVAGDLWDTIGSLGGLNSQGSSAGAGGSGSGESAATASGGADNAAAPDAPATGGTTTNSGAGGLLSQLLNTLEADAAAAGQTIEEYCDGIVAQYPMLPAVLGIAATGAALAAFLYALRKKGGATPGGGSSGKKRKSRKKRLKATKAEERAWRRARGAEGSISKEEFVKWKRWGRQTPPKRAKKAKKSKAKGRRISFMADGKRVTFTAKR